MPTDATSEPPRTYVGCCGAYCGTCKPYIEGFCKGCKLGYATGDRDLENARCRIKVCCMKRGYESCADCPELATCDVIGNFHGKNGHKYRKYRESTQFIREHGYEEFMRQAGGWTNVYGKLRPPEN
ncbi:MAG: DUF3795 domain-containing protein [Coriobacteriia bacterium]|nr:DUF3795 domain-containing protein [Coriobacteriia bacterium]